MKKHTYNIDYARRNLFTDILECGDNFIYADTDSLKVQQIREMEGLNEKTKIKKTRMV